MRVMLELGVLQVNLDFGRLGTVNGAAARRNPYGRLRREPEERT